MFGLFRRKEDPAPRPLTAAWPAAQVEWTAGAPLPIPDWQAHPLPQDAPAAEVHEQANALAAAWVDALAGVLGGPYHRIESGNYMVLSTLDARAGQVLTGYLEKSLRRVLATLQGIASQEGFGKYVVLVFADEDAYYRYISHYSRGTQEQPEGLSSGMFIHDGYGHFVFARNDFDAMERVVVHELTHSVVAHLPLPAWLNEGLAVNTEQRFKPSAPRWRPNELAYLFSSFWNETTIQEFWSGKSYMRSDDGQPLSYELGRILVELIGKDYERLSRFANTAARDDGGQAAALEHLGLPLDELAATVLGPGDWTPRPDAWTSGTEAGQF